MRPRTAFGQRTLSREYFTSAGDLGGGARAGLRPLLAPRRARLGAAPPRQLLPPRARRRERRRAARRRRRGARLPQPLPPPRQPPLPRAQRGARARDPVPLPRLDLRARRGAARRAEHGRGARLRARRLPAPAGRRRELAGVPLRQPRGRAAAARRGARRARRGASTPGASPELVSVHQTGYEVAANWKLFFHNYSECYHCPTVHPHLNKLTPFRNTENDLDEGAVLGGPMWMTDPEGSMTMHGGRCAPPFPGLSAEQRGARLLLHALPLGLPLVPPRLRPRPPRPAARDRPHAHRLRLVLPPRGGGRAGLRPAAGDRVLGPDQPAGLGALRQRLSRRRVGGLDAGSLQRAREPARRLRPPVPRGARPGGRRARRSAPLARAPLRAEAGVPRVGSAPRVGATLLAQDESVAIPSLGT